MNAENRRKPDQQSTQSERPTVRDAASSSVSTHSNIKRESAPLELPEQLGCYRVERKLGEGAMGDVYLAFDTELHRAVALKVPRFDAKNHDEHVDRFYREARAAAKLRHPNICPVYDVGEIAGIRFITMAYIEGRPLSNYIHPDKAQPDRTVAGIVRKLALALEEAHRAGIVHCDLKPANIVIDRKREPIVMDFGLARQLDGSSRLTLDGALAGTPDYMSPEQVRGEREQIGPASDVYSLGIITYELLTGRVPFTGPVAAVLGQILAVDPTPPSVHRPALDRSLEAICLKAMAKRAEDRYQSMQEFAVAVEGFLRGETDLDCLSAAELKNEPAAVETGTSADQVKLRQRWISFLFPARLAKAAQRASEFCRSVLNSLRQTWSKRQRLTGDVNNRAAGLLNSLLSTFGYYSSNRRLLWETFVVHVPALQSEGQRRVEIRIPCHEQLDVRTGSAEEPKVNLPDCCVVCGESTNSDSIADKRQIDIMIWPLWSFLIGLAVGLIFTAGLGWSYWYIPLTVFVGMWLGYLGRSTADISISYRRCPQHATVSACPQVVMLTDLIILRVGNESVKTLFDASQQKMGE